jgi:hypothetical protein
MKTRVEVIVIAVAAVLMGLMGCATGPAPTGGVVQLHTDFPVGRVVADIPFTSLEGTETTFGEIRQPIAIVAFTSVSSETCCPAHPALRTLARRFEYLPITVAQIFLPTDEYPNRQELAEKYDLSNAGIVTLYDAQRIAWKAFYRPKPNTVLLVDDGGRINAISREIENLEHLANRAQRLGERAAEAK